MSSTKSRTRRRASAPPSLLKEATRAIQAEIAQSTSTSHGESGRQPSLRRGDQLERPTPLLGPAFVLSIVIPCFNEEASVAAVISGLLALELPGPLELVAVDDGSSDATGAILDGFHDSRLTVVHHEINQGKGAAVRTGMAQAAGSHLLIFDADAEYDINDIPRLIDPILSGRAEVVYGNRMSGFGTVHPSLIHLVGNRVMTLTANVLFNTAISDLHTCLKLLPVGLLNSFELRETGFGLDTEISGEMLRAGFRPFEVPIGYVGRSVEEGKKIRFTDAIRCFWVLAKVRLRGSTSYGERNRSLSPRTYVRRSSEARATPEPVYGDVAYGDVANVEVER